MRQTNLAYSYLVCKVKMVVFVMQREVVISPSSLNCNAHSHFKLNYYRNNVLVVTELYNTSKIHFKEKYLRIIFI